MSLFEGQRTGFLLARVVRFSVEFWYDFQPLNTKDYYSTPSLKHSTGDIWRELPTFGLLKGKACSGLIITPACDLANHKVETITYLPIIGVDEYLTSRSFYQKILSKIIGLSNGIQNSTVQDLLTKNVLPSIADINFVIAEYEKLAKDNKGIINRIVIGLRLALDICNNNVRTVNKELFVQLFSEKEILGFKQDIIRNNFTNDLHFLPRDEQDPLWSSILNHSVVLFRYPITVPIELLDAANDASIISWDRKMDEIMTIFPVAKDFKGEKPLKSSHLHNFFLSDLLTRFAGLYIRIGSPDFDVDTINQYTQQI
jgi:hypothetical protein